MALLLVGASACGDSPGDTHLDIVYDPCEPIAVIPAGGTLPEEIRSIEAALVMWNEIAASYLQLEGEADQHLPISFEEAAPMFYGVYRDEQGDVVINRVIEDHHERSVVIAHEIGHALGLWHVDPNERVSVMNQGNNEVEPNAGDVSALAEVWGECPTDRP